MKITRRDFLAGNGTVRSKPFHLFELHLSRFAKGIEEYLCARESQCWSEGSRCS